MSQDDSGRLGRLDDAQEADEASDPGPTAARGDYDPAEGSPGTAHPTGEAFPDEAVRYDDPEGRPRSEVAEETDQGGTGG